MNVAVYSPRILSLASGYGGLELGVKLLFPRARTVCYVEREGYAAANLVARIQDSTMDQAPIWDDIKSFDGGPWCGKVDWIIGGYPCQPFSCAGKRRGTEDPRHIWPDISTIIREIEPNYCFFENVSNHLNIGFDKVARDLQKMGYQVAATVVTAEEVGASHKRERLFILALSNSKSFTLWKSEQDRSQGRKGNSTEFREMGEGLADSYHFKQFPRGKESRGSADESMRVWSESRNHSGDMAHSTGILDCEISEGEKSENAEDVRATSLGDAARNDIRERSGRCNSNFERKHRRSDCKVAGFNFPLFPPRQEEYNLWAKLLSRRPDLAPAIESEICKPPNGHPYWVDELRLNGNGVVPLQAAYALATLLIDCSVLEIQKDSME
ncbi:MAG: DNA cytosine methyltransferase [Proteobacteria bacterium]|nr:DNA cytosine methyltransferase [Pseudomonadota bacterium]